VEKYNVTLWLVGGSPIAISTVTR